MTEPAAESPICEHFQRAADLIGRRWNPQILRGLQSGVTRFSDLKTGIPQISDAMLSERLKELEAEGIVERRVIEEMPVRVQYGLTAKGRALEPAVRSLKVWARSWL